MGDGASLMAPTLEIDQMPSSPVNVIVGLMGLRRDTLLLMISLAWTIAAAGALVFVLFMH